MHIYLQLYAYLKTSVLQVKWLIVQIIRNVHGKAHHPVAEAWLRNRRKDEVYKMCPPVAEDPPSTTRMSTRESRISHPPHQPNVEPTVHNRPQTSKELQLQSRLLQLKRDMEDTERELKMVQGIEQGRAQIRTKGVCHSFMQGEPVRKRTWLDGRGRTEAVRIP